MMGAPKALRRTRRHNPSLAADVARATEVMAEVAEDIFLFALMSGQTLPSRERVETSAKKVFMAHMLEAAGIHPDSHGRSADRVRAYVDLMTSHIQVAFQTKWAELVSRHVVSVHEGDSVMQ